MIKMVLDFEKEVANPIDLLTKVYSLNNLSKCMVHNNIYTLYCKNDRKPLCVSCLYSNSGAHKQHKVVPLNKAAS